MGMTDTLKYENILIADAIALFCCLRPSSRRGSGEHLSMNVFFLSIRF